MARAHEVRKKHGKKPKVGWEEPAGSKIRSAPLMKDIIRSIKELQGPQPPRPPAKRGAKPKVEWDKEKPKVGWDKKAPEVEWDKQKPLVEWGEEKPKWDEQEWLDEAPEPREKLMFKWKEKEDEEEEYDPPETNEKRFYFPWGGNFHEYSIKNDVDQGYKLHITANENNSRDVLDTVLPILQKREVLHKYVSPEYFDELKDSPGHNLHGKLITIYPETPEEAAELALEIDNALHKEGLTEGRPVRKGTELKVPGKSGMVHYRYGIFTGKDLVHPDTGEVLPKDYLVHPDTREAIPDNRDIPIPEGMKDELAVYLRRLKRKKR
ncbi:MAG: hypothetical protein KAW41_04085 [Candidatus Diapherotrites archaeon]|nr:hypothetical protein [Candidatus Diapherotrites archaeon]